MPTSRCWLGVIFALALVVFDSGLTFADGKLPGRFPWSPTATERDWKFVVVHHTATTTGDVSSIDAAHRERRDASGNPWLGIGYHFLIGNGQGMPDGAIEATFRWQDQLAGAHAGLEEFNTLGIGICLVGNFEKSPPTAAQVESVRELIGLLQQHFNIADSQVLRHGELKGTACPGKLFDLRKLLSQQSRPIDNNPEPVQQTTPGSPQTSVTQVARGNSVRRETSRFHPVPPVTEDLLHVVKITRIGQRRSTPSHSRSH